MNSPNRRGRFILAWFVAGIAVLPLSVALAMIAVSLSSEIIPVLWSSSNYYGTMLNLAIIWAINGFCIGFLQKAIVTRYLRVDLGRWKVFSVLGALLAGVIAHPCLEGGCLLSRFYDVGFSPSLNMYIEFQIMVAIYLTSFSVVQCLALHRIAKGRWRWVAAHLGSLLFTVLVSMKALNTSGATFDDAMLSLALFVLFVTVVTGFVMLRMLSSQRGADKDTNDEWAYQPAPVETPLSAERSVWDDAV